MTRAVAILAAALLVAGLGVGAGVTCPLGCPPAAAGVAPGASHTDGAIGRLIAAAAPGDTVQVPPGVYHEHLVIAKPITLVGVNHPVIDGDGSGDIVEISSPNVTFRGFIVRDTGINLEKENAAIRVTAPSVTIQDNTLDDILFGIDLREAHDCVIRGNRIGGKNLDIARRGDGLRLWRSSNTIVENNAIHDGRDAILWYSSNITVRNNTSDNCRYGLHLMYSDNVTLEDNRLVGNSVGIYLMYSSGVSIRHNWLLRNRGPSGYGIGLKEADKFTVQDNAIAGNRVGVYLDGSPFTKAQPGVFTRNTVACNDIGFTFLPSARGSQLSENNFIDNIDQISVAGRGDLSANQFWKGERGNYWSDYSGYDQNNDGVGDFVHESSTLFENMLDKEPRLRLFLFSPAQQAIEFVGRALPAVRPEPKFTDEVPLMRPVPLDLAASLPRPSLRPLGLTSLAMLAIGAAVVGGSLFRRFAPGGLA